MNKKKALGHFKEVDPKLYEVALQHIDSIDELQQIPEEAYFRRICRSVVGQQLSVKAASTIWARVQDLIGVEDDDLIVPTVFDAVSDDSLRAAGLSYQKIAYLRSISDSIVGGGVNIEGLKDMTDEEVITELTKLKGIGRWSAEMFLMSALGREDIFSSGDLGLMTGAARLYGFDRKAGKEEILKKVELLTPYRTYASLVLWRTLDNKPA